MLSKPSLRHVKSSLSGSAGRTAPPTPIESSCAVVVLPLDLGVTVGLLIILLGLSRVPPRTFPIRPITTRPRQPLPSGEMAGPVGFFFPQRGQVFASVANRLSALLI